MCDVLVVDDSDLVCLTLVEALEEQGLEVRHASTPDQALAIASEPAGCRLLVTDIDLGFVVNGFGVAAEVQKLCPKTPVLFITGRLWHIEGHDMGPCELGLLKPFSKSDFHRAVHTLLTSVEAC